MYWQRSRGTSTSATGTGVTVPRLMLPSTACVLVAAIATCASSTTPDAGRARVRTNTTRSCTSGRTVAGCWPASREIPSQPRRSEPSACGDGAELLHTPVVETLSVSPGSGAGASR